MNRRRGRHRRERLGLATFKAEDRVDFNGIDNKDGLIFPVAVPDPVGRPAMAMIHRPRFPGTNPHETVTRASGSAVDPHRESMWISDCAVWERLKAGGGAPPILPPFGWRVEYHGVTSTDRSGRHGLQYSAAVRPQTRWLSFGRCSPESLEVRFASNAGRGGRGLLGAVLRGSGLGGSCRGVGVWRGPFLRRRASAGWQAHRARRSDRALRQGVQ